MATLARITIHPVKSLDGLAVSAASVLPSGALAHDRRWQLTDEQGRVVNAKRMALVHAIRAEFEFGPDLLAAPPHVEHDRHAKADEYDGEHHPTDG